MEKGKLKPEDEKCLQKNFLNVKENIDALRLVDRLYTENVISSDDKKRIEKKKTKIERNDTLLHIILDSGPGQNFNKFIAALRTNYSHLEIVKRTHPEECKENPRQIQTCKHGEKTEQLVKLYDITALLVGESKCGKTSTFKTLTRFNKKRECSMRKSREDKDLNICLSNGRKMQLVDSPSINHLRQNSQKLIHEVQDSIQKISKGFHAFLLIIKYRKVIGKEDLEIVKTIQSLYGQDILKSYCILVVTHGDQLEAENESFESWYLKQEVEFKNLLEECGRRAVVIDNTIEDYEAVKDVLTILIEKIDDLQFNGRRYTADHFKKAESGRKRMLIEEKKSYIIEDTAKKCSSLIKLSREITSSVCEENRKKLETLYEESFDLMDAVKRKDECTSILESPLSLIKSVQEFLCEKLKFLNAKKTERMCLLTTLEKEEEKILKTIDRVREKLEDEKQKYALQQEVQYLKEKCNFLEQTYYLELENRQLKTKQIKAKQSLIKKGKKSVILKMPSKAIEATDHNKKTKSLDKHTRKDFSCRQLCSTFIIYSLLALSVYFVYSGNLSTFRRNKNYFWTGLDSESFLFEFINKKTTMLRKENQRILDSSMKIVLQNQNQHMAELEKIQQQQSLLAQDNNILQKNVTELREELNKLRNMHEHYVLATKNLVQFCSAQCDYDFFHVKNTHR